MAADRQQASQWNMASVAFFEACVGPVASLSPFPDSLPLSVPTELSPELIAKATVISGVDQQPVLVDTAVAS